MTEPSDEGAAQRAAELRRFAVRGPGWPAFWRAAADALEPSVSGGGPLAIIVPRAALVAPLQRALRERLGPPGRPWAPPPIRPLSQWADELAPAVPVDALARTLALLQALDEALPDRMPGRAPADRLAVAGGLREVLDAFAQAGAAGRLDDPAALRRVIEAFGGPAAEARLREDLGLLARIARAVADEALDPVAQGIARMRRVAAAWVRRGTRVAWLSWQPAEPLEEVLLAELRTSLPAGQLLRLQPDAGAIGAAAPVLRAAWPECFCEDAVAGLRERRDAWRSAPSGPVPAILHAADREREAQLAAQWVHARLAAASPPPRLAIVAADRWLARRVRALLERAGVLIDDREGWLLSTTVAATAAIGWLDAIASDGYYDDLLGWLDSRHVRPPGHAALSAWVERSATRGRYLRGWQGLRSGGGAAAGGESPDVPEALEALLALAERQSRPQTLAAHLACLDEALRWAGATRRLAADAAGRQLLGLLEGLRRASGQLALARPIAPIEFRAVLGLVMERHRFFGSVDSPVQLLTPADAAGRDFDAVLVLGAAEGALPAPPRPLPLLNEALRTLLGVPTARESADAQQRDLVLLLALATDSAITCRTDRADGTRPSPWVERLDAVLSDRALHDRFDLPGVARRLLAVPAERPAPALARLPARVSVGAIERLVDCPFRFLAMDGWGLREAAEAVDIPGVRERGEWVHEILDRFHRELARDGLRPDAQGRVAARERLVAATEAVAARELAAGGGALGELAEWRAVLDGYLDWAIADAAAGWRWVEGEQDGRIEVAWTGPSGGRALRIDGRLDRLDEGAAGLRVVDYKLGAPDRLRRIAATPPRAAQLALYAWMASMRGTVAAAGYLSLRRDRVAWVPLAQPPAEVLEDWRGRLPRYLARIDAGEPLAASGSACEHCASRGLCRKGHWT